MTDNLNVSLNSSKKSLICNHCMYDCVTYENMKDHYRSEFHKYNLNRVTMNLNPLNFEEYTKKKEMYQKLTVKPIAPVETSVILKCEICVKSFLTRNKFQEHMASKTHKKAQENFQQNPVVRTPKNLEEEKTTIDDISICLFCNSKSESLESNIMHMMDKHKLSVPLFFCVKNFKGMVKLMAKKIITYISCLTCDCQNFKNYRGLQNHMMDKGHTSVNDEDIEEFFYRFYDKKSLLSVKDKSLRITKEYKILKFKLKMKKVKKVKKSEEDGWSTVSEEEEENTDITPSHEATVQTTKKLKKKDVEEVYESGSESEDDYEPITLPNGELLLENGTIVGNKIYQTYYKQRFHSNKYERLVDKIRVARMKRIKTKPIKINRVGPKIKYYTVKDSNKSSFIRINSLFKACKQVNV